MSRQGTTGRLGLTSQPPYEPDRQNRLGIQCLVSERGEWVADGWVENYQGISSDGRPLHPAAGPAVHRGAHMCWQDDMEGVTCHASVREKFPPDEPCGARPAMDLPH